MRHNRDTETAVLATLIAVILLVATNVFSFALGRDDVRQDCLKLGQTVITVKGKPTVFHCTPQQPVSYRVEKLT